MLSHAIWIQSIFLVLQRFQDKSGAASTINGVEEYFELDNNPHTYTGLRQDVGA